MDKNEETNLLIENKIKDLESKKTFLETEIRRAQSINLRGGILGVNMPINELKRSHRNVALELNKLKKD
jgi:hypothetical protein